MSEAAQQPAYRVIIETRAGEYIDFNGFTSLWFSHYLNRGSTAEMVCPLNYEKITPINVSTRQSWIRIYRRDNEAADEVLVWYGLLYETQFSGDNLSGTMTMRFENVVNLLEHRKVPADYEINSAVDQSDILWNLINDSQLLTGGDLGITRGAYTTSESRIATTELQRRSIKDVFESYANVINGLDWEITPTLKNGEIHIFNTYFTTSGARYHKGSLAATPLVYVVDADGTSDLNNCISFDFTEQGKELANSVNVDGAAIEEVPITAFAENVDSITNRYGLFQYNANEPNISDQSTLDDHATELLDTLKEIPVSIKLRLMPHVEPRLGTYDVGDLFNIRFRYYQAREFFNQYRLYGVKVTIDTNGVEYVDLDLNLI